VAVSDIKSVSVFYTTTDAADWGTIGSLCHWLAKWGGKK